MGQAKSKDASDQPTAPPPSAPHKTPLAVVREWADALVIAFLLAMFIRTFVVELFKIPSGSMTPTLVGTSYDANNRPDELAVEWDVDGDGEKDLVLIRSSRTPRYHVFYRKGGKFDGNEERDDLRLPLKARQAAVVRNDRIIVNKFIYWFRPPRRGEIVVFRVPPCIYQRDKPIYIKRVVGLPGDLVEIRHPHVYVNGQPPTKPDVFPRNEYVNRFGRAAGGAPGYRPDYIKWHVETEGYYSWEWFDSARVPPKHYLMFGDNSKSSRDSRDWGAVPEDNLKGKAVFRYWPVHIGFLD
jgi:signal peptidase I